MHVHRILLQDKQHWWWFQLSWTCSIPLAGPVSDWSNEGCSALGLRVTLHHNRHCCSQALSRWWGCWVQEAHLLRLGCRSVSMEGEASGLTPGFKNPWGREIVSPPGQPWTTFSAKQPLPFLLAFSKISSKHCHWWDRGLADRDSPAQTPVACWALHVEGSCCPVGATAGNHVLTERFTAPLYRGKILLQTFEMSFSCSANHKLTYEQECYFSFL